jgi:hypothetical protein
LQLENNPMIVIVKIDSNAFFIFVSFLFLLVLLLQINIHFVKFVLSKN